MSLDDTLTLAVDEGNTGATTDHDYTENRTYDNRAIYIEENHALDMRDQITFYRTFPKPAGNFKGVAKSALKFTKDIVVTGVDGVSQITSPMIIDVGFSFPVGATSAQRIYARQTVLAALDSDTLMEKLNAQLEI